MREFHDVSPNGTSWKFHENYQDRQLAYKEKTRINSIPNSLRVSQNTIHHTVTTLGYPKKMICPDPPPNTSRNEKFTMPGLFKDVKTTLKENTTFQDFDPSGSYLNTNYTHSLFKNTSKIKNSISSDKSCILPQELISTTTLNFKTKSEDNIEPIPSTSKEAKLKFNTFPYNTVRAQLKTPTYKKQCSPELNKIHVSEKFKNKNFLVPYTSELKMEKSTNNVNKSLNVTKSFGQSTQIYFPLEPQQSKFSHDNNDDNNNFSKTKNGNDEYYLHCRIDKSMNKRN